MIHWHEQWTNVQGAIHTLVEQVNGAMPNYSNNTKRSWMAVDLGRGRRLVPNRYCIRYRTVLTRLITCTWLCIWQCVFLINVMTTRIVEVTFNIIVLAHCDSCDCNEYNHNIYHNISQYIMTYHNITLRYYDVRHGATGKGNALRNWELRAREVSQVFYF